MVYFLSSKLPYVTIIPNVWITKHGAPFFHPLQYFPHRFLASQNIYIAIYKYISIFIRMTTCDLFQSQTLHPLLSLGQRSA